MELVEILAVLTGSDGRLFAVICRADITDLNVVYALSYYYGIGKVEIEIII